MRNELISTCLVLALAGGCGFVKINGKPLGGGGGGSPVATSGGQDEEAPSQREAEAAAAEDTERTRRTQEEQERGFAVARGKTPGWCQTYHQPDTGDVDLRDFQYVMDGDRPVTEAAYDFANIMCSVRGSNLDQRPKVMEIRKAWMAKYGLDERDFEAAVALQSGYAPAEQAYADLGPAVAQLTPLDARELDQLGARASMLGRIAYVESCLTRSAPIAMVLCAREPLDVARADAEIEAAPGIQFHTRFLLRQRARDVVEAQRVLNTKLLAFAKEEPAVTKMMAIADAQFKAWATPTPARAAAVKLLEDLEAAAAANKRSGFVGCEAKTGAAWAAAVRAADLPDVSTEHTLGPMIPAVFTTAEAFLARRAFELCMTGTGHAAAIPYELIGTASYRRGPRTATAAAWIAASGELVFDDRTLTLADALEGLVRGQAARDDVAAAGTIARLTPTHGGAEVEISFKPDLATIEDCVSWKATGRIASISVGGAVSYESVCTKRGMVKYDQSPDAIVVDAALAAGLTPGMFLLMSRDGMRLAEYPIVATAGPTSAKAVWLFGVARP